MEIFQNEYEKILDYLVKQCWEGTEFVVYNRDNGPVGKEDLFTFSDRSEAKEFCQEHSTDLERYHFLSLRSVYRCMSEAVNDKSLIIVENGIVDISTMLENYDLRLSNHSSMENKDLENNLEKEKIMNQENFDYLIKQMFYAGLGDVPVAELQKKLQEGKEEFQLNHPKKMGTDNVIARLNFKQSEKNMDMYFFNSFDVLLKKEGEKETMQQNFRISYGNDFRFDEAYKLMSGRSVHKTFVMTDRLDKSIRQEVDATAYMNFKNADQRGNFEIVKVYGYDLEKKLAEYPIKDWDNDDVKNKILTDLKRGEVASAVIATSKGEQEIRITANAQFDTLNFYDSKMKPMNKSAVNEIQKVETVKQGNVKSQGKKENEGLKTDSNSKVIKKPDQAPDKNTTLRVG